MRVYRSFQHVMVALALVSVLFPPASAANPDSTRGQRVQLKVRDVALHQTVLNGQAVDSQGQAVADTTVSVIHQNKVIAQAETNRDGRFAVRGLKSGVYVVSSPDSVAVVRAWNDGVAPPAARDGVLLTPASSTVRGEVPDLSDIGIGGAIVVGTIITISIYAATQDGDAT